MIGYIKGTVEEIFDDSCIVENQGMGYLIKVPATVLATLQCKETIKMYTYMYVREDQLALFGFESRNQLQMFELLISVNGIGPKAALGILSTLSTSALLLAIVSQDAKAISKSPGIGAKTAQKVILELKDKVSADSILTQEGLHPQQESTSEDSETAKKEAFLALVSLGYDNSIASQAIAKVSDIKEKDTETILKEALKYMVN